jgi:hypothetical protein
MKAIKFLNTLILFFVNILSFAKEFKGQTLRIS